MSGKRKEDESNTGMRKRTRKAITLAVKREILNEYEAGMKVTKLASKFKLSHSTVSSILKDKDKYLKEMRSGRPLQTTWIRKRDGLIPEVERMLVPWIHEQTQSLDTPLSQTVVSAKALSIFETLKKQQGEIANDERFSASRGWFDRFKRRAGWQKISQGEDTSTNIETGRDFPDMLAEIIEQEGYSSQLVFNVDETELFWRKIPAQSCVVKEEKPFPDFKTVKEKLTLLLGTNAAGDYKLKPLLVYHAKNPRALKGSTKSTLPVIWKFNARASMTTDIFEDWFENHFVVEVERYCHDNSLPFKALLVMDIAPGHLSMLEYHHPNIKTIFLPPQPTYQPMEQGVISSFKAIYLRRIFENMFETIDKENGQTIHEFLKKFSILDCVQTINEAWNEITESNCNGVWRKLIPQFVQDFKSFENSFESSTETVAEIADRLNIDISLEDVIEFLTDQEENTSNEDILEMVEQESVQDTSNAPALTIQRLSEAFGHIESALKIFMADDPNFERSSKVFAAIRDDYACYREIFQEKKASSVQISLDCYCKKPQAAKVQSKIQASTEFVQSATSTALIRRLNFEDLNDPLPF
uniref:HTH CENPB-type domain-containing protein n=1 Tax=Arion vulgaris TaxID=1028688 RepID=A0A0B6ZJ75_9EUPU